MAHVDDDDRGGGEAEDEKDIWKCNKMRNSGSS